MDSQCPGCLGQAVVTLRLLCAIVESPQRRRYVLFVDLNISSLRSRSIKRRQWKHKLNYYDVVFAHLATGRGINAKDPSGLDSDRWIPHSRCCENPTRAKALAGFSRHLSAGFADLNPAPRGLSQYKTSSGGVCCPNAQGRVRNRKSNPEVVSPRDLTYCSHKPECIGTPNPDRSVLITIITWHF